MQKIIAYIDKNNRILNPQILNAEDQKRIIEIMKKRTKEEIKNIKNALKNEELTKDKDFEHNLKIHLEHLSNLKIGIIAIEIKEIEQIIDINKKEK